ncbi:tryptophan biosynthesis protein [includes: indole-3-glycero phosphate synthase; N-(5'-phospho ribosyl)anthranilate isomerase] [Escherichia coli]|nr:tryptophan biosynthesis protein [includes: indole-3-glycero phosphate synthase; N-(5'-phospho ribosyl)anthranilate isomerase] [Escherichia coli]
MQTVLAKIVADKAIWVEARKQQQPLASFRMRFSRARDIFMMRYRVRARRLFWSARKRRRQKA